MFGRSRGVPIVAVVFPALALLVGATQLAGCSGDDCDCDADVALARQEGEKAGRQAATLRQLRKDLKRDRRRPRKPSQGGGAAPPSSGSTLRDCGSGVSANSVTTCGFAQAVRGAYFE